uniref:Nucleoside-diphosphate kinase n=1 Tax=Rodentolepis nana TaxID=102285 RepID=A0A0R3T4R8_RODNA
LFAFQVNKSSQEQLDEEYDAEIEGFAETGGLEENRALREDMEEEMEEDFTEEEGEEEEEEVVETSVGGEDEESENSEGEEEEEEEDPSRSLNRNLGVTSYYCPVALHEHRVLKPGDPDIVATYKDRVYYFDTEESMSKFIDNPEKYVHEDSGPPLMNIPPLRIAIIGPTGSGKTLHGRQMANQFDLVHVSFHQLLQDVMMMSKLKSRIGPEYADDVEIPVKVMPNLEEEVKKALEKLENPDAASELKSAPKNDEIALSESGSNLEDLSPHEIAIRNYLENDEPLPKDSLNNLLLPLWKQEPYCSKGFVLEGFPQTAEDVNFMLENNLLVDFVIDLSAEAADVVPRLLPIRFMKWKVKMEKILKNKRIAAEWEAEKRRRIREERRKILAEKQKERRLFQTASQSRDGLENDDNEISTEVESDSQTNISEALEEELAEEEEIEEDEEETDSEAKLRLEEEITERVEKENEGIQEVIDALIEAKIPHFNILADDQLTRVRYRLIRKIKKYILNRSAIFERVYSVTLEEAENLIASGFKHFSPFGRYCPVSWSRVTSARLPPLNPLPPLRYSYINPKLLEYQMGDDIVPNNNSGKKSKTAADPVKVCAAVYRECVYWFNSDEERKQFSSNPIAFIKAAGDMTKTLNHQPIQVAIIGDPDTEREQFSQQLAKNLRIPYITPAKAIEWLLRSNNHSVTQLAKKIYKCIKSDSNLPDELIIEALSVALLSPQVQARGYILDNFPLTKEQSKLLMATSFRPMLVLDLHNDQCHHPAGDMNWLENINNEEPSDCPFLKIWLKKHNRQADGAGIVGRGGPSTSADANRRFRDYKEYESDSGKSGRSGKAGKSKKDKKGGSIGSDKSDYDEFGNKIRGRKSGSGRQKGKSEGRDDAKDSKHRGFKRLGSADKQSRTGFDKDGSKSRYGRKHRESEDSIADDARNRRHKHGPDGKRDSSYENSQDRGYGGGKKRGKYKDDKEYSDLNRTDKLGQKGSRRPGYDETKKGIAGSKRRELRRRNGSLSSQDDSDANGGRKRRHRGRRLSSQDDSDENGGRKGRHRDRSSSSQDDSDENGGRKRRHRDRRLSSQDDSDANGGRKRRHKGRRLSSQDDSDEIGGRKRRHRGRRLSSHDDSDENGVGKGRHRDRRLSSQDDSDENGRRRRRHRGKRLSSSASSDTTFQKKGKRSGRRKRNKDVSESSSSSESGQDGGPKRNRRLRRSSSSELGRRKKRRGREDSSSSESTLDSDGEPSRYRGRKRGHQGESDSSSDDFSGKAKRHSKKRGDRNSGDSSYSESTTSDEHTSSFEEEAESERVEIDRNKYRFSDEISSSYDSEDNTSSDRSSRRSSKNLSILRRLGNNFVRPVGAQSEKEVRELLKNFNGLLVDHYSEGNVPTSFRKALLVMTHRMAHFMENEANKKQNKPINISEIGMGMKEFEDKLGEFGQFCPVKLGENDELFDCKEEQIAPLVNRLPGPKALLPNVNYTSALQSNTTNYESDKTNSQLYPHIPTELRFAVEYKGKTYRMAGPNELEKFMNDPERYIPPNAPRTPPDEMKLPQKFPKDLYLADSTHLAFGGFCPVCYEESSQNYDGLKVGNENILALYRDEIYAFCSEECRTKFMHRPHLYAGLKLPNKLPPKKEPVELHDLPLPGYLEQTVANTLLDALAACSKFRPKYPFISPERSALIYLALQLKVPAFC